jgi:uncharacterized protein (TIGR02466 family)
MATDYYFSTPIHARDLPLDDNFNAALLRDIRTWQATDPHGIIRSNIPDTNGWHSPLDMHKRSGFSEIHTHIVNACRDLFDTLHYDPQFTPVVDSMWANINPRHAQNRSHMHPDCLWSGVYYVQAPPDCGRISFSDPRIQSRVISPRYHPEADLPLYAWPEIYFDAKAGRLILFPAWLVHEVEPNTTTLDGEAGHRVSISFNIYQG